MHAYSAQPEPALNCAHIHMYLQCRYDITCRESFAKAREYLQQLQDGAHVSEDAFVCLIANMQDLEDRRQV